MNSHSPPLATVLLLLSTIAGITCCCATRPFLSAGTANSAEVGYSGDLAAATEVAKEHCARYERVPRYLDSSNDIAFFACEQH
ncbi:MAG TPA: hypothetical protein VNV39_04235 [Stellaceae bacterium]|jgi:hypothetical protein|nr:hypothetical protein [Stellaceae bacterium]